MTQQSNMKIKIKKIEENKLTPIACKFPPGHDQINKI